MRFTRFTAVVSQKHYAQSWSQHVSYNPSQAAGFVRSAGVLLSCSFKSSTPNPTLYHGRCSDGINLSQLFVECDSTFRDFQARSILHCLAHLACDELNIVEHSWFFPQLKHGTCLPIHWVAAGSKAPRKTTWTKAGPRCNRSLKFSQCQRPLVLMVFWKSWGSNDH